MKYTFVLALSIYFSDLCVESIIILRTPPKIILLSNNTKFPPCNRSQQNSSQLYTVYLPNTSKVLKLTCTSSYPNEWVFEKHLSEEKLLKTVKISKARSVYDHNNFRISTFESNITLRLQNSAIERLYCRGRINENKNTDYINTTVKIFRVSNCNTFDKKQHIQMRKNLFNFPIENENISHNGNKIYEGQNITFTCKGPSAQFYLGFQWTLQNEDGSEEFLGRGRESVEEDKDGEDIIVSTKEIFFNQTENTYVYKMQITCHKPELYTYSWVNASIEILIRKPSAPVLKGKYRVYHTREKDTYELVCEATGEPQPKFLWLSNLTDPALLTINITHLVVNRNEILHVYEDYIYEIVTNGNKSTFRYEIKDPNWNVFKGSTNFICEAENHVGKVQKYFYFRESKYVWVIITASVVAFLLLLLCIGFIVWKSLINQRKQLNGLSDQEIEEFQKGEPDSKNPMLLPYNLEFEIASDNFVIENTVLGEGAFGKVLIGKFKSTIVAVKTVKKTADLKYFKALLSELKILCYVGTHENIVSLIGCCTKNIKSREVMILMEFCSNGNLRDFVRNSRSIFLDRFAEIHEDRSSYVTYQNAKMKKLSTKDLLKWATEIACGMDFLFNANVVHGDLAARNILITDSLHAKVGDFGLSKQLYDYSIYCPLPLKWMAIESLQDLEFSLESDIWSYGVTLWEIFSLGASPYATIQWDFNCYKLLKEGYRMERAIYANEVIHNIMLQCWNLDPKARPSFAYLKQFFEEQRQNLT